MASVSSHYETLLAPIYLWMSGGLDQALSLGAEDLSPFLGRPGYAVDLGAGFGMHSIPLARAGCSVLAVDSSPYLLGQLRQHGQGLAITAVESDLLDFPRHLAGPADLILCLGDTLTHLPHADLVEQLIRDVARSLGKGGRFLATFRDYHTGPVGDRRFILVRSSPTRIHTCGLEQHAEKVVVHDLIHECVEDVWTLRTGSYEKLRLSPDTVLRIAEASGLQGRIQPGPRGMVQVIAEAR